MNPFSPLTYYHRHKGQTIIILGIVALITAGLYLLGALSWDTFVISQFNNRIYLTKFSIVHPTHAQVLDPALVTQIGAHPGVAKLIPVDDNILIKIPWALGGAESDIEILGLREADLAYVLDLCGIRLKDGHLVEPGSNGLVLSEQLATGTGLQIGDVIYRGLDAELYEFVPAPLEVVGILEGDIRLALVSYEYLESYEAYRVNNSLLIVPQPSQEAILESFLADKIGFDPAVDYYSLGTLEDDVYEISVSVAVVTLPVAGLASLAMALVLGAVNRIALTRRLPELGILNAIGLRKTHLINRLTLEIITLVGISWLAGIGLAWLTLYALKVGAFAVHGYDLRLISALPLLLIAPIPLIVGVFTILNIRRIFAHLDTIAIIECGALDDFERVVFRTTPKAMLRPLAITTFYRRHFKRASLLITSTALMIVSVSLAVFLLSDQASEQPKLSTLKRLSIVSSDLQNAPNADVTAKIKNHLAVARVIPAKMFDLIDIIVPQPFDISAITAYSVSESDMHYLIKLFDLKLLAGRLPQPYTNEVVIAESVAQNRNLKIGDTIGTSSAYWDENLPTPFEIVGIFSRPEREAGSWLCLASLEFIQNHEAFNATDHSLLVVPQDGQFDMLNTWLEDEISSDGRVWVSTYPKYITHIKAMRSAFLKVIAGLESLIALVGAIALATLNYIFVSQRLPEFAVFNALGTNRWQLIWRVARETAFTTGVAWIISLIFYLAWLVYQFGILSAKGFSYNLFDPMPGMFNIFDPVPWLFTLPIPIAVLVVSTAVIAGMLIHLDPVAIIERREW